MRWWLTTGALAVTWFLAAGPVLAGDDRLREVDRLFSSAAYDETLVVLARIDDPDLFDKADEYRALCLIALHREPEAERVVERLVLRHPLPIEGMGERSPKFTALYGAVRRRLVPRLASGWYATARESLAARDYAAAKRQFDETLELVKSAEDAEGLQDLAMLAGEFAALSAQRLEPVAPVAERAAPLAAVVITTLAPATTPTPAPFAPVPRVFGPDDRDVTPPVAIDQQLPVWTPPREFIGRRTFRGQLRVTVGEDGRVAAAEILQSSFVLYDSLLMRAVKEWRYQPATKLDHPVQYRRVIEYVLNGPDQTSVAR